MKTFVDYEELIKDTVEDFHNTNPDGWFWKVDTLEANIVKIRWGYLDYLGETKNCFFLTLREDNGDAFITSRDPHDYLIDGYLVAENPTHSYETSYKSGIKSCLYSIYSFATNNY